MNRLTPVRRKNALLIEDLLEMRIVLSVKNTNTFYSINHFSSPFLTNEKEKRTTPSLLPDNPIQLI